MKTEFQIGNDLYEVNTDARKTILEIAEQNNIPIIADCHTGSCCTDPIEIIEGWENLNEMDVLEEQTLFNGGYDIKNHRLACVARLMGGTVKVRILNYD